MENITSQINENHSGFSSEKKIPVGGDVPEDQKAGLPILTPLLFETLLHSALDKKRNEAISRDEDTSLIEDLHILFVVLFNDVQTTIGDKKGLSWNVDAVEKAFTTFMLYLKYNTGFEYNVSYLKHHVVMLEPALKDVKYHFEYLLKDLNSEIQSSEIDSCKAYLLDGFLKLTVNAQNSSPYEADLDLNEIKAIFRLPKNGYSLQIFHVDEKSGVETLLTSEWR